MSGKVKLEIVEGPMQGKDFLFEEHDAFLFGRMEDCHACLPDDPKVSRHHFIVEANPPDARIRDLGSLNGTYVNGVKHGSREPTETPEEGAKRHYPEVDLKDGDRIEVGDTVLVVHVDVPAVCCQCNCSIADADREKCAWIGGAFLCSPCKEKMIASANPPKKPEPVRCQKCGKDVSDEVGQGRRGNYVCKSCREKAEHDPADLLMQLVQQALKARGGGAIPSIVGYEIEKELGRGGMGAVYLAHRKKDRERVAVKVMLSQVAVDEHSRQMFLREIDNTRRLRHPNIIEFIDHGSAGTAFYLIMEFCDGGDVDHLAERHGGKVPLSIAGPIMLQTLEGLAYAHKNGFVHRDLKPQNILLCGTGASWVAKVSDFGLAKNFQKAGLSGMTMTGNTAGTPAFMPKEQVTNYKHVKPSTDIWSIGATFYNMLTGELPRDFRRGQDPMEAVLRGKIIPIRDRDAGTPKDLARVIDRALSLDVKDRYQDASEMLKELRKAL